VAALVQSWWLSGVLSAPLIEAAANKIQHWQDRIAEARKTHIKGTRRKLRKKGIYLKDLIRCKWP
jgi:hypothetical protein